MKEALQTRTIRRKEVEPQQKKLLKLFFQISYKYILANFRIFKKP